MKLIPLTQGKFAKIDDEDFEMINQFKWYAGKDRNAFYARTDQIVNGKKVRIRMHRFLTNCPDELVVDHEDRDTLNNQKYNLKVCTHEENLKNTKHGRKQTPTGITKKPGGKFRVRLSVLIGSYNSVEEAIEAFNIAKSKTHLLFS